MNFALRAGLAGLTVWAIAIGGAGAAEKIPGYTDDEAAAQRALEARFDAMTDAQNLDRWMKFITSHPHHTGSPHNQAVVDYLVKEFESWGYDVNVETYDVLFPTPKLRLVEMVAPEHYVPGLEEPTLAEDSTSGQKDEQLPIFNAFSADGDVTADVVFVNQGVPADYEDLDRLGISVKGKLVIARYGGSWRGIKPKVAQEKGAIGVILYSDPEDDGYFQGDDYPKGPYRPAGGAQRGSVMDLPKRPGDPLTPNEGATKDAKRLPLDEADTLLKIPVLPISYGDALPILKALGGPVAPERWRGALPITYHVGPGPARVHLKLEFDWSLAPAHNVIARLEGSEYPDEWVMRGNHHDGWVNGASDPVSGLVAMMEEARIVGELARAGNRPKRTIIYGAWDAEEPALLGSTEWVEDHAQELQDHLVAYINTDGNSRGFLGAGGSHGLETLMDGVAEEVKDPRLGVSVKDRLLANWRLNLGDDDRKRLESTGRTELYALGSGSDYSAFLQHIGISSLNLSYGGEGEGGEYHSIYDSYDHFTRFIDPGFAYGVALAETAGRATLRLANAELLPFAFTNLSDTVARYADQVVKLADDMRDEIERRNKLVADDAYRLAADPDKTYVPPEAREPVPHFNFAPLLNAVDALKSAAEIFDSAVANVASGERQLTNDQRRALNRTIYQVERAFLLEDGLPRRPWFQHSIYAPGFYTGYGVKTLPGVREAIEEREYQNVEHEVDRVADRITAAANEIARAAGMIDGDD